MLQFVNFWPFLLHWWKFIVFGLLIILFIVSSYIDIKKGAQWFWNVCAFFLFFYPILVLPRLWKLLFLVSFLFIFGFCLIEGNKYFKQEQEKHNKIVDSNLSSGLMVSYGDHFFVINSCFSLENL